MKLTKSKLKQIIKEELDRLESEIIDDAVARSTNPDVIRRALELAQEALVAGEDLSAHIMNNMPGVEFDMHDENLINDAIKLLQRGLR